MSDPLNRTLKGKEINYFTSEKELIAVVWSLHNLESYLKGSTKIIVRTDHQAITFLNTSRFNNARVMRWSLSIQDFNIELEHIEGKRNSRVDYLSRQMHPNANLKNDTDIIISAINKIELKKETIKLIKSLVNSQKSDEYSEKIKIRLENKERSIIDNYKIQNDLLHKTINTVNKVVIPNRILVPFVTDIHDAYGHVGSYKTFKIINEAFFAPKMLKRIKKILKP